MTSSSMSRNERESASSRHRRSSTSLRMVSSNHIPACPSPVTGWAGSTHRWFGESRLKLATRSPHRSGSSKNPVQLLRFMRSRVLGGTARNPPHRIRLSLMMCCCTSRDQGKEVCTVASKEQKQNRSFAEKLLRIRGKDYEEWLDEQHQQVIQDNQELILEALEAKLSFKSPAHQD